MIAFVLGCFWIVSANVLALIPSRDNHWARAYGLIAIGIPLLVYIAYSNGLLIALAFLVAGMSVLRWPVVYLTRWARSMVRKVVGDLGKGERSE